MNEKLQQVMAEVFEVNPTSISELTTMENTESWDSMSHLRLIGAIEEQFGVALQEDDMLNMTSFSKINEIISARAGQA